MFAVDTNHSKLSFISMLKNDYQRFFGTADRNHL